MICPPRSRSAPGAFRGSHWELLDSGFKKRRQRIGSVGHLNPRRRGRRPSTHPAGARIRGASGPPSDASLCPRTPKAEEELRGATLRASHGPAPPYTQAPNPEEARLQPCPRPLPAEHLLRRFLPPAWPPEIPGSEGDPKASEEHTPVVAEESLQPPGELRAAPAYPILPPLLISQVLGPCHLLSEWQRKLFNLVGDFTFS